MCYNSRKLTLAKSVMHSRPTSLSVVFPVRPFSSALESHGLAVQGHPPLPVPPEPGALCAVDACLLGEGSPRLVRRSSGGGYEAADSTNLKGRQSWGSSPGSPTYWLCDLEKATGPLWA